MVHQSRQAATVLWRWYAALLLANALDLFFTSIAVERGFQELNPLVRPLLLTPWVSVAKAAAFAALGYVLWQMIQRVRYWGRILSLMRGATAVYLAVLAIHVVGLYGRLPSPPMP